jgi:hypothetical protein
MRGGPPDTVWYRSVHASSSPGTATCQHVPPGLLHALLHDEGGERRTLTPPRGSCIRVVGFRKYVRPQLALRNNHSIALPASRVGPAHLSSSSAMLATVSNRLRADVIAALSSKGASSSRVSRLSGPVLASALHWRSSSVGSAAKWAADLSGFRFSHPA